MALDQAHELNNGLVKGSGGAIGLTGNPGAYKHWMVAGPEIARITTEFEEQAIKQQDDYGDMQHNHHDQQLRNMETVGEKQYTKFVTERLENCEIPITETIQKNNMPLFSRPPIKTQSK